MNGKIWIGRTEQDSNKYRKKQGNLHGLNVTCNNSNEVMLHKQSDEEKSWSGFHIERGKDSMVGEYWMYNKYIIKVVFEPASAVKPLNSFLTSFLRCHKDIANLPRYFGHVWPTSSKIKVSTCK